jgi:tRNA dimethylallyltransferase
MVMDRRAILIAGPTASGKSALALALAERLGGTVINADSMQVYRELRILTARPSEEAEARVPHRLYGHVPGREAYSAARFAADAAVAIEDARAQGRMPIVVGGTGLYFRALLEGLAPIPPVAEEIRVHWRAEARRTGAASLHALLTERDPVMAGRLEATDPQRIVRALEVLDATGRSLADWQQVRGKPALEEREASAFVLLPERAELARRCNLRFEAMMEAGAAREVEGLARLDLDAELPVMRALGVRPLLAFLAGALTQEEAVERAKAETRRYAKRQATWIRGNMCAWNILYAQQMESNLEAIISFINRLP